MEWLDNKIQIVPPKRPKKLTATRFATILGLNPWSTPFEVWCEITRTYQKPFEDTIYTVAGKTIEPKQAEYMKNTYFMSNLVTPTDIYGENYFQKTFGDFFSDTPVLGGMWDYLLHGKDGKPVTVLEMKTSKRVEDWAEDIPEYYALQAALYAFLLGVDYAGLAGKKGLLPFPGLYPLSRGNRRWPLPALCLRHAVPCPAHEGQRPPLAAEDFSLYRGYVP